MKSSIVVFISILIVVLLVTGCKKSGPSGAPDEDSQAGIWVATDGSDSNPGTVTQPFRTLSKAVQEASADNREIYMVEGTYYVTSGIYLWDGVSIYGGYGALSADNSRERDIETHQTIVDFSNCTAGSSCTLIVEESTTGNDTTVDGLTVIGKHVGIYIRNASPTISNCTVSSMGGDPLEYGIMIIAEEGKEASPTILNNTINAGDSLVETGLSAGIGFHSHPDSSAVSLVIRNNTISGGRGTTNSRGISGLSQPGGQANLVATGNIIRAAAAGTYSIGLWLGGAPQPNGFNDATIEGNIIIGGQIQNALPDKENTHTSGIRAYGFAGTLTATNNFIYGGDDGTQSSGVYMGYGGTLDLFCNTIVAGSGTSGTWTVALYTNVDADIENNILCSSGAADTVGIYEWPEVTTATVTALKNNLFCAGLATLYKDNVDGTYTTYSDTNDVNNISADYEDNIRGDPAFTNAADYDYHLTANSAAIDHGRTLSNCTTDIDGNARPNGSAPDIGADEHY